MSIPILRSVYRFIFFILIAMFILKIAQVFVMAREHVIVTEDEQTHDKRVYQAPTTSSFPPKGERVVLDYSQLTLTQKGGVGIFERIDDLSFWNTFAALLASVLIYWAACKVLTADGQQITKALLWSLRDVRLYSIFLVIALTAYILGIRDDSMPQVAGTFYARNEMRGVKDIQVVEGVLNVLLAGIVYIPAITGFRLLRHNLFPILRDSKRTDTHLDAVTFLANSGSFPLVISALGLTATVLTFKSVEVAQHYRAVDWPASFATMLFGAIFWYAPYIALTFYCIAKLPDTVMIEFLSLLKRFLWIRVKSRQSAPTKEA